MRFSEVTLLFKLRVVSVLYVTGSFIGVLICFDWESGVIDLIVLPYCVRPTVYIYITSTECSIKHNIIYNVYIYYIFYPQTLALYSVL